MVATDVTTTSGYGSDLTGLVLHETGHGYDPTANGQLQSGSPAFSAAYQADLSAGNLTPYESTQQRTTAAGMSEAFANSFAAFYAGDSQYNLSHPNLYLYWSGDSPPAASCGTSC